MSNIPILKPREVFAFLKASALWKFDSAVRTNSIGIPMVVAQLSLFTQAGTFLRFFCDKLRKTLE